MKEPNPSIHSGTSYSTKRPSWRTRKLLFGLTLLAWWGRTSILQAQDFGNEARFRLITSRAEVQDFYRQKQERARSKELERALIPQYNVDLSLTLSQFHKHIADMHHQHVACSICREHVKKIKQLTKKIDQGMK